MSWNLILCLWLLRINGLFFVLNARAEIFAHFSKSSSSWQNKGERILLKIQKKSQNALLRSSRSEIFFRTRSILRSRILGERQRNATWNAPRTRSVLIFLLGYFCPVLYILVHETHTRTPKELQPPLPKQQILVTGNILI